MALEKNCNKRKDKEWCEWRKAKKQAKLTEHRRKLKRQRNKNDFQMSR